jgi:hypothetical protein
MIMNQNKEKYMIAALLAIEYNTTKGWRFVSAAFLFYFFHNIYIINGRTKLPIFRRKTMKKFVINSKGCGLYLTDEHVAWLRANGYPEADHFFCKDDRSNPDLIACVEAIHASKLSLAGKAAALLQAESVLNVAAEGAKQAVSAAIEAFVEFVHGLGCRLSTNSIILAMRRPVFEDMTWDRASCWFASRFGVDVESAKPLYEHCVQCYHDPAIVALGDATRKLAEYCEENGLRRHFDAFVVDDGLEIKVYDETKFEASLCRHYAEDYPADEDYEFMELKPFLTRDTIASFVDAGDVDGMMDYLKSLNVGCFMDIRDDRVAVDHTPARAITPEDQAMLDALMAQIN